MADLPAPESRKEQYLAKAAGVEVSDLPEPASREEQYLNAIAEGGGSGGGTSDFNDLENRPTYAGEVMSGDTDIPSVESVKGAPKELTEADYNYPTSNPTQVALWLLDQGLYTNPNHVVVRRAAGSSSIEDGMYLVANTMSADRKIIIRFGNSNGSAIAALDKITVSAATGQIQSNGTVVVSAPVDNLTTNDSSSTLSAAQGKALNDKIGGDLSNLDTTDKTSLINAINEIAENAGGIKTLTADNYNYPESNPDTIALWLLEPGMYNITDNTNYSESTMCQNSGPALVMTSGNSIKFTLSLRNSSQPARVAVVTAAGDTFPGPTQNLLGSNNVMDDLTSTSTTYPLSANQGKILKDMIDALPTGGITELTTADYNYPTSVPTQLALWLLEPGIYKVADSTLNFCPSAGNNDVLYEGMLIIISAGASDKYSISSLWGGNGADSWKVAKARVSDGEAIVAARAISPEVVQTTGDSTTAIMSQNAATKMVYPVSNNFSRISIGGSSSATGQPSTAIGFFAKAYNVGALALGDNSTASHTYSVAFPNSTTSSQGEIATGFSDGATWGYNNSQYRLLTGLYDPQSAHDAATKGYVDAANSYSTDEVDTGTTWVDGKTIYKKTINVGALPNNSYTEFQHNIDGIESIVKYEGVAIDATTNATTLTIPYAATGDSGAMECWVSRSIILVATDSDRTGYTGYITIYYTKSA